MSGIGEASLALGIISSIISIVDATKQVYEAVEDEVGLPANFKKSATKLPLILKLLEDAERYIDSTTDKSIKAAFTPTLEDCKVQATHLQQLFEKVMPKEGDSRRDRYVKAARTIGKGGRVEMNQRKELKESLRCRWDEKSERFVEDVTSWRTLWDIFLEMLEHCKCQRLYVIVDALDECQDDGMANFLKRLVRTGLHRPSKIKWLLTSRPLDTASRELLAGFDQVLVSLELNSRHISKAVKTYIAFKMDELDRRCSYGETLRRKVETELTKKAEDTYLWVSLVCKRLESVHRDKALSTIQELPPGLHPFYNRVFNQLSEGEPAVVKGCMRLLKAMMLAYRPLNVAEVASVSSLSDEWVTIEALVDRCASFIKMRGITDIEFVHQSARDYLAGKNGQSIFDANDHFAHGEIALSCLSYLSQRLKVNLVDLPRPDSTRELMIMNKLVVSVDYAATFWVQHLESAKRTTLIQNALTEHGEVSTFLSTKLLIWLECLSLLDKLPRAIETLKILADVADSKNFPLSMLVQDAIRFLLRHYRTIATWPLQIYSSAIVFSPQTSIVKRNNLGKLPAWLRKFPQMEDSWASLIQTLAGHSRRVLAVAFSPDGKQITSGSHDETIRLWDAITGDLQNTLAGHSEWVLAVVFSPDGKQIASGSYDSTVKLWDATIGDLQKTLTGYLEWVLAVAFSPDGKQIASGSDGKTIKLWNAITGDLQKTLAGHSSGILAVAFSPDGKQIASGSHDSTIKLWNATIGNLQKTLAGHSDWVSVVAFSPDGKQIASGSEDVTIKLWDAITGDLQKTLAGHSQRALAISFSPDGKQIASGSHDMTIKLWNAITGDLQKTLAGHSSGVSAVAFSPDGKQIASGSYDKTIKLWNAITGDLQKTLAGHSDGVLAVAFSPDGKHIALGSDNKTIRLWDVANAFKVSILLGRRLSSRLKFRACQDIMTLETVDSLKFSADGRHLATNFGLVKIESTVDRQSPDFEWSENLRVSNQWICYKAVSAFLLPLDFVPHCHDVRGDQVAIGFMNGRVLIFDIDRISLNSMINNLA
ncbi:WD40-repeat-containing domain protein [Bisporella sp. PMI_857]|nr:WD40-repeat-containing domain protein [Bisporella sp. PMI_857]